MKNIYCGIILAVSSVLFLSACDPTLSQSEQPSNSSNIETTVSQETSETTTPVVSEPISALPLNPTENSDLSNLNWGMDIQTVLDTESLKCTDTDNNSFILYDRLTQDNIHIGNLYYNFTNSTFSQAIYTIEEPYQFEDLKAFYINTYGVPTSDNGEIIWDKNNTRIMMKEVSLAESEVLLIYEPIDMNSTYIDSSVHYSPAQGNKPTMSLSEFDMLKEGMSEEQVYSIVGSWGTLSSQNKDTELYTYEGEGSIGANALVIFQKHKLVSKSQAGLE